MQSPLSRRHFLMSSAGWAAGAWASTSGIASAARPRRRPSEANDQITLGFIGTGGMGRGLINTFKKFDDVNIAAVCDVYDEHARRAVEASERSPDVYQDFRRVLDRTDIDAVVIATPDHWHAIPTIMACQAGKDIYCEKPLTWCIGEGDLVVNAVERYDRITQMGNLIHATDNYHRVAEIIQSGALGPISKARIWMAVGDAGIGNPANGQPPEGCDYDFWLGPAPDRPFNPNRFTFNWRYFWDYGGGYLSDFICHLLDPIHWGMQAKAPETVTATGARLVFDDNAETPDTLEVSWMYPEGWQLVWSLQSGNTRGFRGRSAGFEFVGTKGSLHAHYGDYKILPFGDEPIEEPESFLPRSPGHHREWLNKIKTREQCSCNFRYGHEITTVGHLGNIALHTGEVLNWDAEQSRFTNSDAANARLFRPEYRKPWTLPDV